MDRFKRVFAAVVLGVLTAVMATFVAVVLDSVIQQLSRGAP